MVTRAVTALLCLLVYVSAWNLHDDCYQSRQELDPIPTPRPVSFAGLNVTARAMTRVPAVRYKRDTADGSLHATPDDSLHATLYYSNACYDEAVLSGECGSVHTFEDDCALLGLGNHEFKICSGLERFAMQCNVSQYGQYTYRVIGANGFDQHGCVGSDCAGKHCLSPEAGDILFSTATEPDALMVMHTKHQVHYHKQLRSRLKLEGFITYPTPDADRLDTWCNGETIMKVYKNALRRGSVRTLGYGCEKDTACPDPSPETMSRLRHILESEYPSAEIGLAVGMSALAVVLLVLWASWRNKCCLFAHRKAQKHVDEGICCDEATIVAHAIAMESMQATRNPQSRGYSSPPPAYRV